MGKDLNNLFSGVIFVHFFASVVSLCVIIYQLSRLGTKNPTYWIMISSVGTILTQTFLYCYYGEKIIEKVFIYTNFNSFSEEESWFYIFSEHGSCRFHLWNQLDSSEKYNETRSYCNDVKSRETYKVDWCINYGHVDKNFH